MVEGLPTENPKISMTNGRFGQKLPKLKLLNCRRKQQLLQSQVLKLQPVPSKESSRNERRFGTSFEDEKGSQIGGCKIRFEGRWIH